MLITGSEVNVYFKSEVNRTFYYCWDINSSASVEFNHRYTIKGGVSLGQLDTVFDVSTFVAADVDLSSIMGGRGVEKKFLRVGSLWVSLAYMYNGLPEYKTKSHAIVPLFSLKGRWVGLSLGVSLRFTEFDDTLVLFESNMAAAVSVNFYNTDAFRIGLKCANFSEFVAGAFGAYFLSLNSVIRLTKPLSITSDIELYQSGSVGLASNFYAIAFRVGVVFTW
ncbi:MAG: hypothetical protein LBS86_02165 [Treponema sp.]|nr:hypothetical protein [Treponema sp.]